MIAIYLKPYVHQTYLTVQNSMKIKKLFDYKCVVTRINTILSNLNISIYICENSKEIAQFV